MRNASRIVLTYAVLALIAIPWYWRWLPNATMIVGGVPAWVASAIAGSALVSCYTAWLLGHPWADELPREHRDEGWQDEGQS